MALNKTQLKMLRKLLLKEHQKLIDEIHAIENEALKSPRDASGDLSAYTVHMADMAADTYDRELSMNIVSSEHETLHKIEDAIKRIDNGTYGSCEECEHAITISRLKVVPYASMCITCQRKEEQKNKK